MTFMDHLIEQITDSLYRLSVSKTEGKFEEVLFNCFSDINYIKKMAFFVFSIFYFNNKEKELKEKIFYLSKFYHNNKNNSDHYEYLYSFVFELKKLAATHYKNCDYGLKNYKYETNIDFFETYDVKYINIYFNSIYNKDDLFHFHLLKIVQHYELNKKHKADYLIATTILKFFKFLKKSIHTAINKKYNTQNKLENNKYLCTY